MDEIDSGKLSLGDRLPGELELVSRYQVSRFTVREALRILENRGFISRQRGKGTVVTSVVPSEAYRQTVSTLDELLMYPSDTKRKLISVEQVSCDESLRKWTGCEEGATCTRYSQVRSRAGDGVPLCWQDIYLRDAMQKYGRWLNSNDSVPDPKIFKDVFPLAQTVAVDICAGHVQKHMAGPLKAERGTPTLCVVRRFVNQGSKPMSVSVSEYPEGRYTFSLEFTREWQPE
jgi:DNA-binding GntR family transcriptional regulator